MTDTDRSGGPSVSPIPEGSNEGLLTPFNGAHPPAPDWFQRALAIEPVSHFVEVAGAPIHYRRWGNRGKPGLLLTHGNGAHAHWWDFIAPFFAGDYNVAAITLGGMGDSSARDAYSMDTFTEEQLAVATHAGLFEAPVKPIFVGHSFGGFVTIVAGARHGARLGGVVLVDSPVRPPESHPGRRDRNVRPTRIYPTLEQALSRFRLAPPQQCENLFIVDYIARHSLREVEGGWTWKFDPKIWQHFTAGDPAENLQAIGCRIGIFRGENSAIFTTETAAYMHELLGRQVPIIAIPEAAHHVMLDQPLALVAALRSLLADWDHSVAKRKAPKPGMR